MPSANNCLLVRNKPYGKVDIFDLAKAHNCAFLGYPAIRKEAAKIASSLSELVTPFNVPENDWAAYRKSKPQNLGKSQEHRNKWCALVEGESLLLMPRSTEGRVYIGTYTGFTFHPEPLWQVQFLDRYTRAVPKRKDRDTDLVALASVCQTLNVDKWSPVPFVNIPAWIRAKCFGQSGAIWLHPSNEASVVDVLKSTQDGRLARPSQYTSDIAEVASRLVEMVTPEPLEHLMVALLQLEFPEETWLQVGGAGDGGVDGVGFSPDGKVTGVLQCKWQHNGRRVDAETKAEKPIHLAYLQAPQEIWSPSDSVVPYDRYKIAELVVKHAAKLPLAITLKVRSPTT